MRKVLIAVVMTGYLSGSAAAQLSDAEAEAWTVDPKVLDEILADMAKRNSGP